MKFINPNKVYWVKNKDLNINYSGGHNVIITRFDSKKNICRVKAITSLEKEVINKNTNKKELVYKKKALEKAKNGLIEPMPIKALNTDHWSGISNDSRVISIDNLIISKNKFKKPIFYIKKKSKYKK